MRVAQLYLEGPNRNCKSALAWFERASENGAAQAMYELGKLYRSGDCANRNNQVAYTWFRRGARYGSQESRGEAEKLAAMLTEQEKRVIDLKIEKWIGRHSGTDKAEDREEKEEKEGR